MFLKGWKNSIVLHKGAKPKQMPSNSQWHQLPRAWEFGRYASNYGL